MGNLVPFPHNAAYRLFSKYEREIWIAENEVVAAVVKNECIDAFDFFDFKNQFDIVR